jgi:hypothetical protein
VSLELRGDGGSGAEQLARMLERFETLLADALARPMPPWAAAVASAAEREGVLERFGRAAGGVDAGGRTVVELFEEQAAADAGTRPRAAPCDVSRTRKLRGRAGRAVGACACAR